MSKRAWDEEPAELEQSSANTAAASALSSTLSADARRVRLALGTTPSAEMYERSYMHRDHVSHVLVTSTDFIVTASRDGQIKFWKKMQKGIEFVKHFRAHLAPISCISVSHDGTMLASTGADKAFKVFDVLSFDMINWVKLDFIPGDTSRATALVFWDSAFEEDIGGQYSSSL
jgi:WD40 repeat protein